MRSRGSVVLKRISNTPSVSILPGERVFHKLSDGTYEPATITLEAVVQNVDNPKYQWGRIVGGSFRPYSVVYSHMIASPVHAGVVAVKVTGDNVPNAIIASEVLTIVEDGVSPVQYRIVVKQLDRIVTSISCDANGNPKLYYQATAYLYKITGSNEEPCGDFLCIIAYYKGDSVVKADISPGYVDNYTFIVDGDYDSVRIGFSDGENVIVETTIAKTYDGAPSEVYSIEILQNGKPVNTIASDAEGYPKLEPTAFARLYKKVGNSERTVCSDFYCKVVSMNSDDDISDEEESGVPVSDYEFEVADNYYDSFAVSFFDKASKKTVAESSISRTFDGSTGESGYTYRSRGMFTTGETYVWNSEYRDIVFSWFNNKLYAFRVKNKGASVTVPPTSSNGDDNWDDASELEFVATDLLLAQNAIVNLLQGNEVRVLDGNGIATAGMSGSGSGDSGIRFYAGSDDPQTAPFRVDENGKVIANNIVAYGSVATPFIEITDDNYEEYSVMYPDNTGIFINISNKHGFNYKIGNHLSIEPVVISLPYDYDNDGVEVNIASYRTLISYAIIVGAYDINKQKEKNIILNPIDLVRLKCVVLERGNSNDSDDIKKQKIKWIHLSGGSSNL
ncbi:hypothetical protein [Bacteroides nordii]|uniref:hypothetical protein n=1 Tax=Bacteroides nordii TaxID=291645 RepID=UPI00241D3459|nr:hypothetical protein [Bacteroides nordii]